MIKDAKRAKEICDSFGDLTMDQIREMERKHLTQYLFFGKLEAHGQLRECFCTACQSTFHMNVYDPDTHLQHGESTCCPICGGKVKAYKSWLGRGKLYEEIRVMKFEARNEALFVRIIEIRHSFERPFVDYWDCQVLNFKMYTLTPEIVFNEKWRFYIAKGEVQKYEKGYNSNYFRPVANDNSLRLPVGAIEGRDEIDKMFLRYFNVWEYFNYSTVYDPSDYFGLKYIITAAKHPNIEYIDKGGFSALVRDLLSGNMKLIKWSSNNLKIMLGLDKTELHMTEWNAARLRFHHEAIAANPRNRTAVREILSPESGEVFDEYLKQLLLIMEKLPDVSLRKIHNYAQGKYDRAVDWKDYLNDFSGPDVRGDLSDTSMTFPKDLQAAKDRVRKQISFKKDAAMNEAIKKREKTLKKFMFSDENYTIVLPTCTYDLVREGNVLKHCVGSYARRHSRGDTTILFIRKKNDVETPFYTMEVDIRRVKIYQCRGYKNSAATESVAEFENQFIEHMKQLIGKNVEVKTA